MPSPTGKLAWVSGHCTTIMVSGLAGLPQVSWCQMELGAGVRRCSMPR